MKSRISLEKYQSQFPESGTVNIHHCKEGKNNDRFYLTKNEDGSVVGYCFHCGASGVYTSSVVDRMTNSTPKTKQKDSFQAFNIPPLNEWETSQDWQEPCFHSLSYEFRKWWLAKCGLNVADVKGVGVKFLRGKFPAIPLCEEYSLSGLAIRPLSDTYPKWILAGSKYVRPFTRCQNPYARLETLVITEDVISALRCSKHAYAMPLLGTTFTDKHLEYVLKYRGRVLIWLDNDNREVVAKAKAMYNRISPLKECAIWLEPQEPKHFIHEANLREAIHG